MTTLLIDIKTFKLFEKKVLGAFSAIERDVLEEKVVFRDTFDWSLRAENLVHVTKGDTTFLYSLQPFARLHTLKIALETDLFTSHLANDLIALKGPRKRLDRRLLPFFESRLECENLTLLNAEKKIVGRLELWRFLTLADQSCHTVLWIKPVRGYPKLSKLVAAFADNFPKIVNTKRLLKCLADNAIRVPGNYQPKPNIKLAPQDTYWDATMQIFQHLTAVIEANIDGIKEDLDSEFLHDFRVAIRRTRSGLSLFKGLLMPAKQVYFKNHFAVIAGKTNTLRDIDVFEDQKAKLFPFIPVALQSDAPLLFRRMQKERSTERNKVIRMLNAAYFKNLLTQWKTVITTDDTKALAGPEANRQVIDVATQQIRNAYRAITKKLPEDHILENDEAYHRLRIEFKKFRYLLEFYSSLYPGELNGVIKTSKHILDILGLFSDLSVFSEKFMLYLNEEHHSGKEQAKLGALIGAMLANIDIHKKDIKQDLITVFADFRSAEAKRNLKSILAQGV
jgi:CHAD domain-containing protein